MDFFLGFAKGFIFLHLLKALNLLTLSQILYGIGVILGFIATCFLSALLVSILAGDNPQF